MSKLILAVLAVILFPFLALAQTTAPGIDVQRMPTQGGFNYFKVTAQYQYLGKYYPYTTCVAAKGGQPYNVEFTGSVGQKSCDPTNFAHNTPKLMNPDRARAFQFTDSNGVKQELQVARLVNTKRAINPDNDSSFDAAKLYLEVKGNDLLFGDEVQALTPNADDPLHHHLEKQDRLYNGSILVVPPGPQATVNITLQPIPLPPPPVVATTTQPPPLPAEQLPILPPPPAPKTVPVETKPVTECRMLAATFPKGDSEYCNSLNDENCTEQNLKRDCHFGGQSGCNVTKCLSDYDKEANSDEVKAALKNIDDAWNVYSKALTALGDTMKSEALNKKLSCINPYDAKSMKNNPALAYQSYMRLQKVYKQRPYCHFTPDTKPVAPKPAATRRVSSVEDLK